MLRHYLSTAMRHLRRHKMTTAINVLCLGIGLTGFLATHWLVRSMSSADGHLPGAERIYVVTQKIAMGSGLDIPTMPVTAMPVARYLRADFPQLDVARATFGEEVSVAAGPNKGFATVRYVDPEFLDIFALPFYAGDATALRSPRTAAISEEAAIRLFGSAAAALQQRVLIDGNREATITAITREIRSPSHMQRAPTSGPTLHFDMLVSMDVFEAAAGSEEMVKYILESWNAPTAMTYVRLPADGSLTAERLGNQFEAFAARHTPIGIEPAEFGVVHVSQIVLTLLNAVLGTDKTGIPSTALLYILGGLVLAVSCLNYINLATAQATSRAKEVGMRRVVGARSGQVVLQHLLEAGLLALGGLLLAVVLGLLWLAWRQEEGSLLTLAMVAAEPSFWAVLLLVLCTVTLGAGAYPAFVVSRIRTVDAIRAGQARATPRFVQILLVGAQFVAASFLLISILVMGTQNAAVKRAAQAALPDPFVVITSNLSSAGVDPQVLRTELLRRPHVEGVAMTLRAPWSGLGYVPLSREVGEAARRSTVFQNLVDDEFLEVLDFDLAAGRLFDRSADVPAGQAQSSVAGAVIDRALAEQFGWRNPQQAIGELLYMWPAERQGQPAPPLRVVGVVENKALSVVGLGVTSNLYILAPALATTPVVRLSAGNIAAGLAQIDAAWNELAPNVALKRRFGDELLDSAYRPYELITAGFAAVASLAFVNAILGLIGMSIHVIGRRTHEIGVRKTLGASAGRVLRMLLQDFSKPVIVANLIAWPLAFLAMKLYLSIFTHAAGLSLTPFALSLTITLVIAWAAVLAQAARAARLKPATVLRHE